MEHFARKYEKIRRHLAERYCQENRGLILDLRSTANQRRTVIKQESKDAGGAPIKAEVVKNENGVKTEQAQMELDASEFEERFEVMAMGVVADELP